MIAKTRRAMLDIRRQSAICGFTNARALTVRRLVNTESACDGGKRSQLAGASGPPLSDEGTDDRIPVCQHNQTGRRH